MTLPLGYPVPTHARPAIVARAKAWLGARGIHTLGRFGEWDYINADEALHRGLALADGGGRGGRAADVRTQPDRRARRRRLAASALDQRHARAQLRPAGLVLRRDPPGATSGRRTTTTRCAGRAGPRTTGCGAHRRDLFDRYDRVAFVCDDVDADTRTWNAMFDLVGLVRARPRPARHRRLRQPSDHAAASRARSCATRTSSR